jgi:glutathione S-transferase
MKLYYAMGTCSFAPHVALREAGLPFDLVRFDMKKQQLEGGRPIEDVNEKGYVPVLELDGGERLTEVPAVLQWIADRNPGTLAPPNGTMERYRLQEWLNFIATEIHKVYWPLFHDGAPIEKENATAKLVKRFEWIEKSLGSKQFLTGETFTIADAYLLTVLNWTKPAGIDLGRWPRLKDYWSRLRARPAVRAALEAEGLVKKPAA